MSCDEAQVAGGALAGITALEPGVNLLLLLVSIEVLKGEYAGHGSATI